MNNFNELNVDNNPANIQTNIVSKDEQNNFNKRFLIKLMLFMFFIRFYLMHIDEKGVMIDFAEDCFNELTLKREDHEENYEEELIIDEVD